MNTDSDVDEVKRYARKICEEDVQGTRRRDKIVGHALTNKKAATKCMVGVGVVGLRSNGWLFYFRSVMMYSM